MTRVFSVALIIGVLAGMAWFLRDWFIPMPGEQVELATVELIKGSVAFKKNRELNYRELKTGEHLPQLSTVRTNDGSSVVLSFATGARISVRENSLLVMEKGSDAIMLSFLKGYFDLLEKGSGSGRIMAIKDNIFQDLAGFTPEPLTLKSPPPESAGEPLAQLPTANQAPAERSLPQAKVADKKGPKHTLSNEYITNVVRGQKPYFNRCYALYLRSHATTKGAISLSFQVEPSGKVGNVNVLNSTLGDGKIEKCVMAVIERCRFFPFDSDPIVVNFPITFE